MLELTDINRGVKATAWFQRMAKLRDFRFVGGTVGSVRAEINQGRWLVQCPFCAGAEIATPDEKVFFCLSCGMVENDSHPMKVIFPRKSRKKKIERILSFRERENQNWLPDEGVAQLRKENREHGLLTDLD